MAGLPRERGHRASATALFWPAQSTLLAGLTTRAQRSATFAMQRVVMNLGIGLGGVAGGFIASESFQALFLLDALTFVAYAAVLTSSSPTPLHSEERPERTGSYRTVFRHKVFMALMAANSLYIGAGIAQLEILPAFAKNEAGVSRARDRLALLHQHDRDRAAAAADDAARRGAAAHAAARAARRRLRGGLAARARRAALWLTGMRRLRAARGRRRGVRARRVPARRRPAGARRRPRRPAAARPLHGDLGALLAGRVHGRPRRRRCAPRRLSDRALARDGVRAAR